MRQAKTMGRIAIVPGVILAVWGTVIFHSASARTGRQSERLRMKMSGNLSDLTEAQKMTGDMMRGGRPSGSGRAG